MHAAALALALFALPQEAAPAATPVAAASEDPAARALWDAVVDAAVGARKERVTSFVLDFDATRYAGESQSNDASAKYRYMEPGWVRMTMKQTGRERLRGPEGDWLIDKAGAHRLAGRDFKQDRAELDESVAVARTFAHLTDPRGLRLESLTTMPAPPKGLPARVATLAGELDWLRIESRDLRGAALEGDAPAPPDVLELGVERASRVPRVAVLRDPRRPGNTLALAFGLSGKGWAKGYVIDGFRVPSIVTAWRFDAARVPAAFPEKQSLDLWFVDGTLAPKLTRDDFLPPK